MYRSRKKQITFFAILIIAALLGGYWLFTKTQLPELARRESAKLFRQEYIPNQNVAIDKCLVSAVKDSLYTDFRKKYRFHYPILAQGDFADSSHLIVISEPPPYFEMDSIASIFAKFTHLIETRQHTIGYDGSVTDILISVGNATAENMHNLVNQLCKQVYLSDYKPFTVPLPVLESRAYFSQSNLDYQITLDEFNNWFIENEEFFVDPEDSTAENSIQSIFSQQKYGVFFSKIPGFVAWSIPKKSDLANHQQLIRQFSLDADLILGALADSATLVIVGRERETSLHELPPLNVESVLLLASISEKELSQSLDVNDFMAGKMKNGRDWCPTYLSKELENTEIGHLLTITDILLKDWSEHGTIQEAHYRYPKPAYYPFDKPLFKKLGLNELVYNWNTQNAMYAIDLDNVTIYTLNHTGSLPVSYFNSSDRSISVGYKYEAQAYRYFSTLGNTDLARVVQYTALYQLFVDNEISYSGDTHSSYPKNKAYLLYKPTLNLLTVLKNLSDGEINALADTLASIKFKEYQNKKVDEEIHKNESNYNFTYSNQDRTQIYNNVKQDTKQQMSREFYGVKQLLAKLSDEEFQRLAKFLSYPRGYRLQNGLTYALYAQAHQVNQLLWAMGKNNLSLLHIDLNDVKNFYVGALASSSAKYLKTPSVIITFNDFQTTGGHNISSRISRVNSTTNYKRTTYTPTEYSRPVADNAPLKKDSETPASPTASTPSAPKATNPSPVKTTPSARPTSQTTPIATSKPTTVAASSTKPVVSTSSTSTRPRSAVISPAPRTQRGF